tara:strand:+ start:1374 stop:2306 length:933 start_codon:yes stop_codon:yes gene_type:complete
MATTTTVTSNYAGSEAGAIIGAAFKESDTLRLGLVTVAENVNYKMNLRKIAYADGTIDYTCGFAPQGSITLTNKVIEPKKVMNPMQICKEDFRATWSGDTMGGSAANDNAPADIMEAIQVEVLSSQAEKVDAEIWSGVNATDGEIGDGFVVQFAADGDVIKANNGITALNAATTEANVQAHLKAALAAVPSKIRRRSLTVCVSPDVFQAYNFKMISLGQSNDGTSEEKQAKFGRYMLTEVNGLADNTIIVFEKSNLIFATGLQADYNEISLVDEDEIGLLTGQIRGKVVYSGGMGYYRGDEVVWLLTTTA